MIEIIIVGVATHLQTEMISYENRAQRRKQIELDEQLYTLWTV